MSAQPAPLTGARATRPGAWGRKVALSLGFEKSGARPRRERPFRHEAARLAQTKRRQPHEGQRLAGELDENARPARDFGSGVDRLQQAETVRRALNIDEFDEGVKCEQGPRRRLKQPRDPRLRYQGPRFAASPEEDPAGDGLT